ncbi:hypothetical protein GCM10025867_48040 (plasmid) [Frondihabitans sucicola]|uniref:Uncharacterized protein n=1 Tax=Frondihabitans sucicola TaxID=1268041 RepID=A0ABN6Y980_9MICO|nr:hypothetical protein [Frondihabitans sucicola]BDZ52563.1 hypothetical protein GCM10025867_48040 [Frondihabitans sucicola]
MTKSTPKKAPARLFASGYMVGYDGSKPGEKARGGGWVLPEGGMDSIATLHSTFEGADGELGGRRGTTDLFGKPAVLRVHHVRALPFPLGKGGLGYRTTGKDRDLRA